MLMRIAADSFGVVAAASFFGCVVASDALLTRGSSCSTASPTGERRPAPARLVVADAAERRLSSLICCTK